MIDAARDDVTLINVFTVAPDRQGELVELLEYATENVMAKQPGYVSAAVLRGIDGGTVAVYARWRSVEDFQRLREDPEVRKHLSRASDLATFDPHLYEVTLAHQA